VKRLWGFSKVRYRGLAKNTARVNAAFALANVYMARRKPPSWGVVSSGAGLGRPDPEKPGAKSPHRPIFTLPRTQRRRPSASAPVVQTFLRQISRCRKKMIEAAVAEYYDLNSGAPADLEFYAALVPSPNARVLELGCGTGRVLTPLARQAGYVEGIDASEAMLSICRRKLQAAEIPMSKARTSVGDVRGFTLGREFDLILAPYRLVQNLVSEAELNAFFRCIREHLSPTGACVLHAFRPKRSPEELRHTWISQAERFRWEVPTARGRITCHERRPRIGSDPLVLYSELIWRQYDGDALTDHLALVVPFRCYYPDEFSELIRSQGFEIMNCWGGYAGEEYGTGPELVVQFQNPPKQL
jgi:SAM-dependent methyltransferase